MRQGRLFLVAAVFAALALPAAAQAAATGGTAAPGAGATPTKAATGGAAPTGKRPVTTPAPAAQPRPGAGSADVPAAYLRLYRAAGRAQGIDWRLIAAVGKIESDHGRSTAPGVKRGLNFAKCCAGPMQFCTVRSCGNTWGAYAVDGNGDGRRSVYDPADAIPAAASLLASLRRQVGGRTDFILAGYNAGPAYVVKHRRVPPYRETRNYIAKALAYIRTL